MQGRSTSTEENNQVSKKITDRSKLSDLPLHSSEETLSGSSSLLQKGVHYGTKFLGIFAYLGNFSYGWFSRTYTAKGITQSTQLILHNSVPNLPKNYGAISLSTPFATPLVEIPTILFAGSEAFNGIAFFDLNKETVKIDNAYKQTFKDGFRAYFIKQIEEIRATSFKRNIFNIVSEFTFKLAAFASAYGRAEQLETSFEDWFGNFKHIPIFFILAGSYAYYKLGYSSQYERGLKFLCGEEKGLTLTQRYKNHGNIAIELQPIFEGGFSAAVRGMSLSFLLGRLAEHRHWAGTEFYYAVGAIGGFINAVEIFYPATHDKYHLYSNITESERNQVYQEYYGKMALSQRILVELARPLLIGLAQSGLSCYFAATKIFPILSDQFKNIGCPSWLATLLASIPVIMATGAAYYPFYKADLYRDLNLRVENKKQEEEYVPDLEAQLEDNKSIPTEEVVDDYIETEENADEPKPSRCATLTGILTSAGSQISRMFVLISSVVGNPLFAQQMSAEDLTAISIAGGTIVGDNRYHTMTEPTIKTLAKFHICQTKTKQGFFGKKNNDDATGNDLSSQALLNQNSNVRTRKCT